MSEEKKKATQKSDPKPKTNISKTLTFRKLTAEEIEVRVARCSATEVELLLYKDARCDMNILDETVGPFRWKRDHKEIKGVLFCTVSIFVPLGVEDGHIINAWVEKTDCGTVSNMEPQKGEASDSFKRACFNWGIGRELYTAPRIKTSIAKTVPKNNTYVCYDHFSVEHINIEDGRITELSIINDTKNARAYAWSKVKGVIEV